MATLRHLHQMMNERSLVRLTDGRVGKIVRVDTTFPENATTVTVWTNANHDPISVGPTSGPGISKVSLTDVVGEVESQAQKSA